MARKTRKGTREGFLEWLESIGMGKAVTGRFGAGKGLHKCQLSDLHNPVPGRPGRGEHYGGLYDCQSPLCPESAEKRRFTGSSTRLKSKLELLEVAVKHSIGKQPKHVMITLLPPVNKSTWWSILGVSDFRKVACKRGATEEDVANWERAAYGVWMQVEGSVRYPSSAHPKGGAFYEMFGYSTTLFSNKVRPKDDIEHRLYHTAVSGILELAENTIERTLRRLLKLHYRDQLSFHLAFHPLGRHGFYPHIHAIVSCIVRSRSQEKEEWRVFSPDILMDEDGRETLEHEWRVACVRSFCGPFDPHQQLITAPYRPSHQTLLEDHARNQPVGKWMALAGLYPVWKRKPAGWGPASNFHQDAFHSNVRVIGNSRSDLAATINYVNTAPLTHTYQAFLHDPTATRAEPYLGNSVKTLIRLQLLDSKRPSYLRSCGIISGRAFGDAIWSLLHLSDATRDLRGQWKTLIGLLNAASKLMRQAGRQLREEGAMIQDHEDWCKRISWLVELVSQLVGRVEHQSVGKR